MSKTDPINPNVPAGGEDPKLGDNRIRALARAIAEILNKDHYIGVDSGSGYDEDAAGEHNIITLRKQTSAPTEETDKLKIYNFEGEWYVKDASGNAIKITTGGILNACNLTGVQTIAGVKTFSAFPVTPSEAPTSNYQAANKKYVDDKDAIVAANASSALTTAINGCWKGVSEVNVLNASVNSSAYENDKIDCSGIVGANSALVMAYISCNSASRRLYIRDKSGGTEFCNYADAGQPASSKFGIINFIVDTDGKADAKTDITQIWNIWVIGYLLL